MRPFWSGTVTFGLVSVPVDLYPAHRSSRRGLRMLSPAGNPLRRQYYHPGSGKAIANDQVVRGYEVEPDQFVIVTDEELEAAQPERTRDISLQRFVDAAELDPIYFDRAYFLTPGAGAVKAYRLLAEVMQKKSLAGIARFVMRGKEYLIAILAENGVLRAETLRFADEIRTAEDVGLPEPRGVPSKAVKAAAKQIRALAVDELPQDALEDEDTRTLETLVARKQREGADVVHSTVAEEGSAAGVIDLMEVLKRSLREGGGRAGPRRAGAGGAAGAAGAADGNGKGELENASKAALYERAQELDIPGRSSMTKAELVRAIRQSA